MVIKSSATCFVPLFKVLINDEEQPDFLISDEIKNQSPASIITHFTQTLMSDTLKCSTHEVINLIVNCQGIINEDLLTFITAIQHAKKIRPSLSLNIEACKLTNSLAKTLAINGMAETFLMPFSSPLLKKRAMSMLSSSPHQKVILCDIKWQSAKEFTLHVEQYSNDSFEPTNKERIGISGCTAIAAIGDDPCQLNQRLFSHCSAPPPATSKSFTTEPEDALYAEKWLQEFVLSCLLQAKLDPVIFLQQDTAIIFCSKAGKVTEELSCLAPAWLGSRERWLRSSFNISCDIYEMSAACASAGFAIKAAEQMIQSNHYKTILIVGIESSSCYEYEGLKALRALSQDGIAKPFDANRNGIVLGHGGGAILLESESSLNNRKAKAQAWLTGACSHIDLESPALMTASAVHTMLKKLPTNKIDAIVAHATGTIKGDKAECEGIISSVSSKKIPIVSIKGAVGHLLYASAFPSIFIAIRMLETNQYPTMPTTKIVGPDILETEVTISTQLKTAETNIKNILINNFGFYGCYSAVILEVPIS